MRPCYRAAIAVGHGGVTCCALLVVWALLLVAVVGPLIASVAPALRAREGGGPAPYGLTLGLAVGAAVTVGVLALLAASYLRVEVHAHGLRVRFFPFHLKAREFPWVGMRQHKARTYRPIREYGGWGLRGLGADRAYNVSGNRGVQLVFTDGRRLLIGSQRADELDAAIARAIAATTR